MSWHYEIEMGFYLDMPRQCRSCRDGQGQEIWPSGEEEEIITQMLFLIFFNTYGKLVEGIE